MTDSHIFGLYLKKAEKANFINCFGEYYLKGKTFAIKYVGLTEIRILCYIHFYCT